MAPTPDSGAATVEVGDDFAGESAETDMREIKDKSLRLWQTTCNRNSSNVNWSSIFSQQGKNSKEGPRLLVFNGVHVSTTDGLVNYFNFLVVCENFELPTV
ncbi:hypothetical protein PanWU01x14_128610 [Parasponia andersonii]|uniref:Uncharacterized protein n=1 Tax=Parasponia andersonii TaxID=3476 RepID=A0A2P5CS50_PARAD|nr:hypothetical protein PanWU01x14_128610 [Parasponia andersonii]